MGAKKGPKVECRSRSGGSYSRGGQRWSSEFIDVPEALLNDRKAMDLLAKDPHLEIKVDGEYVSGPRAKKRGDSDEAAPAKSGDARELRRTIEQLDARIAVLEDDAVQARAEAEAAKKAAADATAQLDALKAAAAAPPATPPAPPPADGGPTTKDESAKAKPRG